jgi:hypothetical protein
VVLPYDPDPISPIDAVKTKAPASPPTSSPCGEVDVLTLNMMAQEAGTAQEGDSDEDSGKPRYLQADAPTELHEALR